MFIVASDHTYCYSSEAASTLSSHPAYLYIYHPCDGLKQEAFFHGHGICRLSCVHRHLRYVSRQLFADTCLLRTSRFFVRRVWRTIAACGALARAHLGFRILFFLGPATDVLGIVACIARRASSVHGSTSLTKQRLITFSRAFAWLEAMSFAARVSRAARFPTCFCRRKSWYSIQVCSRHCCWASYSKRTLTCGKVHCRRRARMALSSFCIVGCFRCIGR